MQNCKPKNATRGFTLVELLVVIVIIAALAGLTAPRLISMRKKGDQVTAMNNGRNLMVALLEFSNEYGGFPDRESAKSVTDTTGSTLNLNGDTANDYFRQLLASKKLESEDPCWSKTPYSKTRPDNIYTGTQALEAGEVGFGYIMGADNKAIPADSPNRVVAGTPLLNATTQGQFDPAPLDNKAALVYVDGRVVMQTIREDKKVSVGKKTLLDSGDGTMWGTDVKPVLKAPKKK